MNYAFDKYRYRILLASVLIMISLGTMVYHFVEKFSWVDAYYFSVVTLATVGYGDLAPETTFGKIFTTLYILFGVGIITAFITLTMHRRATKIESRRKSKQQSD